MVGTSDDNILGIYSTFYPIYRCQRRQGIFFRTEIVLIALSSPLSVTACASFDSIKATGTPRKDSSTELLAWVSIRLTLFELLGGKGGKGRELTNPVLGLCPTELGRQGIPA